MAMPGSTFTPTPLGHEGNLGVRYQLRKEYKIPKRLQSCIAGYRDIYKQLTTRPSTKNLHLTLLPKSKSIEIVQSSDESDIELIHYRALDYDE
ncbi:hypothetical protein TNCV_2083421 [Trichonephila clavipes]|nr:hypothetical protein TNCV_2083421 [Trichonephila clavipes]